MRLAIVGILIVLSFSAIAHAQEGNLYLEQRASNAQLRQQARQSAIGNFINSRNTLSKGSLRELIQSAAPVSSTAPMKYPDFSSYWAIANRNGQRTGKALEAMLAHHANKVLSDGEAILVTAVEGYPSDATDLVRVSRKGEVLQRYQAKLHLNLKSASKYLVDPRYADQELVTTHESMKTILRDLGKAEAKAARRGIPLGLRHGRVANALATNRLHSTWFEMPLPPEKGLAKLAEEASREQFHQHRLAANAPTNRAGTLATTNRLLTRGTVVVNVATMAYGTYHDFGRYSRGEVGGGYLATKGAIRAGQATVTVLLLFPEPVVSKIAAGVASLVLIVADVGFDVVYDSAERSRQEALQKLLDKIDRSERIHNVRYQLLKTYSLDAPR